MRKNIVAIALLALLATFAVGDVQVQTNFLATAVTATASSTITNGTDFTSREITVGASAHPVVGITVVFTRAVGAASTLDFNFQVSYDNGTTWADYDDAQVSVATNHAAVSGNIVRYYTLMGLYGASHIRLKSIVNNWGTNCTSVNVSLSTSRAR